MGLWGLWCQTICTTAYSFISFLTYKLPVVNMDPDDTSENGTAHVQSFSPHSKHNVCIHGHRTAFICLARHIWHSVLLIAGYSAGTSFSTPSGSSSLSLSELVSSMYLNILVIFRLEARYHNIEECLGLITFFRFLRRLFVHWLCNEWPFLVTIAPIKSV